MLNQIWEWWTSNLVWSLFFLVAGLLIVSPLFLSRSFRKRLVRSDNGIEVIEFVGFIVFIALIVGIGIYNNLGKI